MICLMLRKSAVSNDCYCKMLCFRWTRYEKKSSPSVNHSIFMLYPKIPVIMGKCVNLKCSVDKGCVHISESRWQADSLAVGRHIYINM